MTEALPQNPMLRRVAVANEAVAKFKGRPLDMPSCDCSRMAAFVLKAFGYQPALARFGSYSSEAGALRAVRRAGFDDVAGALDSVLGPAARIPPASALPCDIIGVGESDKPMMSLSVALGNRKLLGFRAETGRCEITAADFAAALDAGLNLIAWRV